VANAFHIKQPQLYRCHVYRYHSTLSRLYIRALKNDETAFYLLFSDVGYFEGALNWQGANFRIAPPRDCMALMQKAGLLPPQPELAAALMEVVRLYVCDTEHVPVKIVAGSAVKLNEVAEI
jgi:hypothetical protein